MDCGYVAEREPARLSDTVWRAAASYDNVLLAFASPASELGGADEDVLRSVLDHVIGVRDAVHLQTNRLIRLATVDSAAFSDLDPGPMQPFALDFTWAAVTGVVANLECLAGMISRFPADRWSRRGSLHGRDLTATELANDAVHEAIHHLLDIERLAPYNEGPQKNSDNTQSVKGEDHEDVGPPAGASKQRGAGVS